MNKERLPQHIRQFLLRVLDSSDFDIVPLAGDASARRYYRIIKDRDSWVLMSWEAFKDDDSYPFLSVHRHFSKNNVSVPSIVDKEPQSGLILLEDLGDLTLERKFWEAQDQSRAQPFYRLAVDELIKIHYQATGDSNPQCTAFTTVFNKEKFLWELNYGRKHLIEELAGITLTSSENQVLDHVFDEICTLLDQEHKYISHRDFHSRNLMIKLNDIRVIDFQDARLGPVQYDLISLVHDSYVNLSPSSIDEIIDDYYLKSKPHQPQNRSRDHFNRVLRLQTIQRCFKACGSFASFKNTRDDDRYLKYIHPSLQKVANALKEEPRYTGFLDLLQDRGLLEREFVPR